MKNKRHESKLSAKIDKADRKQRIAKEREKPEKREVRKSYQGLRPIGDDLSSQNEAAEDELEKVGSGPE